MPITNPTFSESWYRVAQLRPRLRSTVQTRRQHFRGRVWHIVQDPANNSFFRLHPAAYRFVAMLDGRRTVADSWRACNATMGDEALTQSEAVSVLGQMYSSNLIQAELPPDAEGLFRRHRKRRGRQVRTWLTNFLFLRIPLFDPDRLLGGLDAAVGWLFSPVGLVLWLLVVGTGVYFAASAWGELAGQTRRLLQADRLASYLPALYAAMVLTKIVHELSHGVACKRFGRQSRGGGEVHAMGIMLLVFAPVPYVDASSAWALRGKLHRCVVGAAGMLAELALAAVGAVTWVWTAGSAEPWQQVLHATAFNVMLISSVSTIVFNANFLLRFDGYYILSDLLEIPNLAERSRQYVTYLVKRWAFGVRGALNPAQTGERVWLLTYGLASTAFKLYISVAILLMLGERYFEIGLAIGVVMAFTWLVLPLGRFLRYLVSDQELARTRLRAFAATAVVVLPTLGAVILPDAADHWHIEGTVEPIRLAYVHAGADGFIQTALPDDSPVVIGGEENAAGTMLIEATNRQLAQDANDLDIAREIMVFRRRIAQLESIGDRSNLALVQILDAGLASIDTQRRLIRQELTGLNVRAPIRGRWICPESESLKGRYVKKGKAIGKIADLAELKITAECPHRLAGMLLAEAKSTAEIRLSDRSKMVLTGTWEVRPAGGGDKKSERSGAASPGSEQAAPEEKTFELVVTPQDDRSSFLLPGQRVTIRFDLPRRPLLAQWWRSFRQLAQRRLGL